MLVDLMDLQHIKKYQAILKGENDKFSSQKCQDSCGRNGSCDLWL